MVESANQLFLQLPKPSKFNKKTIQKRNRLGTKNFTFPNKL